MIGLARAAYVIARRDFTATVFSRAFLLFLLGPLFPVVIGVVFGTISSGMAGGSGGGQPPVAVVASEADYRALADARQRLDWALPGPALVQLTRIEPEPNSGRLRERLLHSPEQPVLGVLEGGLSHPRLTGAVRIDGTTARQLELLIDDARRARALPDAGGMPLIVKATQGTSGSLASARELTARAAQSVLFVLTLLLATMTLSQLIEEKSNKIIEVLASAIPVDAIFLGKLLAMLAASLLGIAVWAGAGAAAIALFAERGLGGLPPPAVGWSAFLALGLVYFATSYLLLGALFLSIGAHASSAREVQTLSMPVTMAQVVVFAVASLAIGQPSSAAAIAAAVFPLSSPYVMVARAAELPALIPHLLAVLWQLLWVALILRIASRLFRRTVLKSGPRRRRLFARR